MAGLTTMGFGGGSAVQFRALSLRLAIQVSGYNQLLCLRGINPAIPLMATVTHT